MKNRTCVRCGSGKYYCKGLCKKCYRKQLVPNRWCRISDGCLNCGTSERPHKARGLCERCYGTQETETLCACGCGLFVPKNGNRIKNYRKGHWMRGNKDFMDAHIKAMMGEGNPQYGKFGKEHPAYGHQTKPETRELRRQMAIKRVANQKKSRTDIEIILSNLLDELGVEHISQHPIKGKFVVDEFLPKYNVIIEANGDYWHGNPVRFTILNKIQKSNRDRDASKFNYLHKCGYRVLYFWEYELKKHRDLCIRRILDITKYSILPFA